MTPFSSHEWLEADGLGGFASGTASGIRTRRYHALLLVATTPPTGRMVLVNGLDAWVETGAGKFLLSSQRYAPDVITGQEGATIEAFGIDPWPHWIFKLPDGCRIEHEIFVPRGQRMCCLSWRILGVPRRARLHVRPFLSGRDYHSSHKSNASFRFDAEAASGSVTWHPYEGVPAVTALSNGNYQHEPLWYYNFLYAEEQARGLDCTEDLASPGTLSWDLKNETAAMTLTTTEHTATVISQSDPLPCFKRARAVEMQRRKAFKSYLDRAADAYIVERQQPVTRDHTIPARKTLIAGYPWFTDWGRDTFISLRGLCLATGRQVEARDILLAWSGAVSEGMLPNRFPDRGELPEYNSVDASLWFIVACYEYLRNSKEFDFGGDDQAVLGEAIEQILDGYSNGTRYGIHMDEDGLLACGEKGVQLTWMDAKVGDWVVTPRIGKPVEVQALWLNALWIANQFTSRWEAALSRGLREFRTRFWNAGRDCLYDVIDVDHRRGRVDETLRPNQILAIGGLPLSLLEGTHARAVVDTVERTLLTPLGLRSLAQGEPGYCRQCSGGVSQRDAAYHQGTVWPWLMGPFVEGWVRVHGNSLSAKSEARRRFVTPLLEHLEEAGLGHISEITDAESPFTPRGCPFQAWSLGELLRLDRIVLREHGTRKRTSRSNARELVEA